MAKKEIVNEWLKFADEDYNFASINLKEHDRFYSSICFHYQQAAEKYLKAFIVAHKLVFKKIHDLTELIRICSEKDKSFRDLLPEAKLLTDFYVDTRYPVVWPIDIKKRRCPKSQRCGPGDWRAC